MVKKEYFGEGKNIEFKREIPDNHEKFLKDIIAFSNSTGGQVILGVEDEADLLMQESCKSWSWKDKIYLMIPFRKLDVSMMKKKP